MGSADQGVMVVQVMVAGTMDLDLVGVIDAIVTVDMMQMPVDRVQQQGQKGQQAEQGQAAAMAMQDGDQDRHGGGGGDQGVMGVWRDPRARRGVLGRWRRSAARVGPACRKPGRPSDFMESAANPP